MVHPFGPWTPHHPLRPDTPDLGLNAGSTMVVQERILEPNAISESRNIPQLLLCGHCDNQPAQDAIPKSICLCIVIEKKSRPEHISEIVD
jgi:hypothetical protein